MLPDVDNGWLAGAATALAGLVGTGAYLRRRLSRDRTEIANDRASEGVVAELQRLLKDAREERDAAKLEAADAAALHEHDVRAVAMLTAERDYLQRDIDRLMKDFEKIKKTVKRLSPQMREFLGTDYSELDPRD
jgi:hypothetical protein